MNRLIQTETCSIVYGTFHGEPNQELFRCPRELDDTDLRQYVNENRCLLGFEPDTGTEDLRAPENFLGYYRMYFRNGWYGRWMYESDKLDQIACHGVNEIIKWLQETFPNGCNHKMKEFLSGYPVWDSKHRYLLKPILSNHYKILFDITYGNNDYPVRIYVYE